MSEDVDAYLDGRRRFFFSGDECSDSSRTQASVQRRRRVKDLREKLQSGSAQDATIAWRYYAPKCRHHLHIVDDEIVFDDGFVIF